MHSPSIPPRPGSPASGTSLPQHAARSCSPGLSQLSRGSGREAESATFSSTSKLDIHTTFDSMKLKPELLRGIYSGGFSVPSPIQQRCIVPMICGKDVVAQAQSGTGKTVMIGVVALQVVSPSNSRTQVVVLSPTRELAVQTADTVARLGEFMPVRVHACVGGRSVGKDIRKLEGGGIHVLSGTPGRVYDMIRRSVLELDRVRLLIVDEADQMLGHGFKEQLYDIYRYMPEDVQVALVSATLPREVVDMSRRFMSEPVMVLVKKEGLSLESLKQFYVDVEQEEWKFETLCDLYETLTITQAVIFCNSRAKVEWLAKRMQRNGFAVSSMHSGQSQKERDETLEAYRGGSSRVLIATDLWSRGIDVKQVSLVINYDMPPQHEAYLHRIGRSGRFGRTGVAITFVTSSEIRALGAIERSYSTRIPELPSNIDDFM
eukprot:GFKZ01000918.1.p1 GENE.GFKZ01000918.1~~GFKZ01000918.1.p1  ORF type:complete len:432 (-),score=47.67 GFKZ01000918.1:273-1568(-)